MEPDKAPAEIPAEQQAALEAQAQETKQFQLAKEVYEKKLNKIFKDMNNDGIGMIPTITISVTPVGGQLVTKPMGTNYTLVKMMKPPVSKKAQKEKKKARKKKA